MDNVREEYIDWLISKVNNRADYDKWVSEEKAKADNPDEVLDFGWTKLFRYLDTVEFQYTHPMDKNRYGDGLSLRWQYEYEEKKPKGTSDLITGPCSMLEMTVALALKIEGIMENPAYGDRTKYWFGRMMFSLGLRCAECTNQYFDLPETKEYVDKCLERFFKNEYAPDGHGGLFIIYNSPEDLSKLEIWIQLQRWIRLRD